jgi:hypothetical protein
VVVGRLREAETEADFQALAPLSPQIYQLASSLLPGGTVPATLPAQATPDHGATLMPASAHGAARTGHQTATLLPAHRGASAPAAHGASSSHQATLLPANPHGQARILPASMGHDAAGHGDFAPAPTLDNSRSLFLAVQVGSYRSQQRALQGWHELQAKAPDVFQRLRPRIENVDLGSRGVFYRLKAGPMHSPAEQSDTCQGLQARGIDCAHADFTGVDPA